MPGSRVIALSPCPMRRSMSGLSSSSGRSPTRRHGLTCTGPSPLSGPRCAITWFQLRDSGWPKPQIAKSPGSWWDSRNGRDRSALQTCPCCSGVQATHRSTLVSAIASQVFDFRLIRNDAPTAFRPRGASAGRSALALTGYRSGSLDPRTGFTYSGS